jgi:hypothetical protein
MANATFNGDDGVAAAASPPARVLVIEVDTLLLPPHLLLMEEDDDDNDDDNDNGAMAKASALTNVAIARNAAAALALMMMFECGIFVVGSGTEEMIHSTYRDSGLDGATCVVTWTDVVGWERKEKGWLSLKHHTDEPDLFDQ